VSFQTIDTPRFHWRWQEFGNGPEILIAFHGFNRSPADFIPFGKWLGNHYTILACELLGHGGTTLKGPIRREYFTYNELAEVIELMTAKYGAKKFSLMAYSFGGRLAFNCVEMFPERINSMYLMAPDALRFNPGYWFAAQTSVGRVLMRFFSDRPAPVLALMSLLGKTGIYHPKAMEFYKNHIRFGPMRDKVKAVWLSHRKTVPDLNLVTSNIREQGIRVLLFFGQYDTIIPTRLGRRFVAKTGNCSALIELECGHRLTDKHLEICDYILSERSNP
jgi:pimeloyl-ACP methyl ester carboxylesterase